jgi:hypothetical protein
LRLFVHSAYTNCIKQVKTHLPDGNVDELRHDSIQKPHPGLKAALYRQTTKVDKFFIYIIGEDLTINYVGFMAKYKAFLTPATHGETVG